MYTELRKFLAILIIAFSFLCASSFESINDIFSLSLPDTSNMEKTLLYYDVDHQELLRESLDDTLLSRYTIRSQNINFVYVAKDISFYAGWSGRTFDINDLFASNYTLTNIRPISHTFDLRLQTKINNYFLRSEVQYGFSRSLDTLFITDFPVSEQSALNNYFFDLLPLAFGDTIPYRQSTDLFRTSTYLGNEHYSLFLEYTNHSYRLNESHVNTGDNNLNGPRESLCKLKYSGIKALGTWKINKHSMIWTGINYSSLPLNWQHTVFPDEPDTLEIVNIAGGITQSLNLQVGYHLLSFPFNFKLAFASGFTNNSSDASTPVLGYVLGFLPISHQADMSLKNSYLLGHLHFDYPLKVGKSLFTPRLDFIASRFWTDLSLQALLQFGLDDIDIQERYIHAAYITSLGCTSRIALNRDLSLWLEIDQLIPYLKTISPVIPSPPPDDIKRYGGLSVKLGVSMAW